MKKQNKIQQIIITLQKTIFAVASLHLVIIAFHFVLTKDFRLINAFHILDLQIFYPPIENGSINFILSWIFVWAVFLFFLYTSILKKK